MAAQRTTLKLLTCPKSYNSTKNQQFSMTARSFELVGEMAQFGP